MTPPDSPLTEKMGEFSRKLDLPALGVARLHRGGALEIEVMGTVQRGGSEPVTTEDAWHIGSCGKSITAALYARLVEAGQARWGMAITDPLADLAGGIHPAWAGRTIDELLVCRSGMRANLTGSQMRAAWLDDRALTEQRTQTAALALAEPPGKPGRFRYSNLGYIVAGAIIDRVAGIPFEDALHRLVFEPLGITSAGFGPPPRIQGHGARLLLGPLALGRGPTTSSDSLRSDNPPVLSPAGRIHLTLADWARFLRVFVEDGAGFLQPETIEALLRSPDGKTMSMGWAPAYALDGVSHGMQGSNTRWSATTMIDDASMRIVMVVANDGRTRVLRRSALFAAELLD